MSTANVSDDALSALKVEVIKKKGRLRGELTAEIDRAIWQRIAQLRAEAA